MSVRWQVSHLYNYTILCSPFFRRRINMANNAFSVEQLAKRWGMTPKSVYTMIHSGRLPAFKPGASCSVSKRAKLRGSRG